ncbi:ATP-binding protein [Roseomonas aeriglobus]|nr:ATP-binding protein [Roseomonas aeriglobus]
MTAGSTRATSFISTQEHRRFIEFADAVRKHRYIGLCHGPAGVGKTLSAAGMPDGTRLRPCSPFGDHAIHPTWKSMPTSLRHVRFSNTFGRGSTLRELRQDLPRLLDRVDHCIDEHVRPQKVGQVRYVSRHTRYVEMVIVDEAERLSTTALEYMRDVFDRQGIGLILIGMPGIEKRMARYPQLFSRSASPTNIGRCRMRS